MSATEPATPASPSPDEAPWKAGLRSARANLVPGLVLQAFALAVVLGYYFHPPTRAWFDWLAHVRTDTGLTFGVLTTSIFGGVIPSLYLKSLSSTRSEITWSGAAALTAYWGYKGVEVGLWYSLMARLFGERADVATIAVKTFVDQFVYCPVWAVPTTALYYLWMQSGFSFRVVANDLRRPRWYAHRVLPMLCANLGVWLPLVCIIYALPTPLQLPLQNIVLCFYTLLLAHMSRARA